MLILSEPIFSDRSIGFISLLSMPISILKRGSFMFNSKLINRILSSFIAVVVLVGIVLPSLPNYVQADEPQLCSRSIKLYPDVNDSSKAVSLKGLMPQGATAEAVDVTQVYDSVAADSSAENVVAAYDITIKKDSDEYQPGEKNPVRVEISDPAITKDSVLTLWHIKDNGEKEEVTGVFVTDGKVCFYASGFSVYVIVDDELKPFVPAKELASQPSDLVGDRADSGFYMFYGSNPQTFASSSLNNKGCLVETTDMLGSGKWFIEPSGEYFKISTLVNGTKKYLHNKSGNELEFSDTGDLFEFTRQKKEGSEEYEAWSVIKKVGESKYLQHSNGGGGIRYYDKCDNITNVRFYFYFADVADMPDDPYGLGNKTYGIMSYDGGSVGNAFMASDSTNYLRLEHVISRDKDDPSVITPLYISQNSDITMWTFVNESEDQYKLKASVGGTEKFIRISGSSLVFTDSSDDAEVFKLSLTSSNDGSFTLASGDEYLTFDAADGFAMSSTAKPLRLAKKTTVKDTDSITYTASRISISDGDKACDGREVIVYTRIWDDVNKKYDFYAIDHDGSLKPCYASGDKLMWLDDATNSLMWKFTVYTDDSGKETGYYELQNTYSGKYIAPQLTGGQVLSNDKIGIQIPGRKYEQTGDGEYNYGEYYSSIVAWDKRYYDYAALKGTADRTSETGSVSPVVYAQADSFYFAVLDEISQTELTDTLHEVKTIDNADYGITMRAVNFGTAPGKSGAEGSSVTWDYFGGITGEKKGLLSSSLDPDGHPIVALSNEPSQIGLKFDTAFANAAEVNHLFIKSIHDSSGYFDFDSCQNFATLRKKDGTLGTDFRVYKELGTTSEGFKTTLCHGQFYPYNDIVPGVFAVNNPENTYSVFANYKDTSVGKLSDDDPRKYEKLHLIQNTDYYHGMEMDAKFVQTPSGLDAWGHDVIFEFTGDDDFWLYVDGELIIDLGGTHSAQEGKVNFRTGEVKVQNTSTTLRDLFINHYKEKGMSQTEAEAKADTIFVRKVVTVTNADGTTQDKTCYVFNDYSEHSMKVYYMERGAGASNLHMRFNLSSVTPGNVLFAKKLSGAEQDLADMDYSLIQYPFQIMYKYTESDEHWQILGNGVDDKNKPNVAYQNSTQSVRFESSYTPPNSTKAYQNVFFLTPNKNIEINFPDDAMYYQIVECAVNLDHYSDVKVNGKSVTRDGTDVPSTMGNLKDLISNASRVSELPTITFDNGVKEGNIRTLNITKKLYNEDYTDSGKISDNELHYESTDKSKEDKTRFNIRLYLSNGTDDDLKLADMCRYYVVDPSGYLCHWNADTQHFESTSTLAKNVSALSDSEKNQVTFHSSRYGAISNIPAGYTVRVPGLPAGTKFMVEERENEIPSGYALIDYDCVGDSSGTGSYYADDSYTIDGRTYTLDHNSPLYNSAGTIRAGYDAEMDLNNRRGVGLEAEKIWSDSDFTKSHDAVYTAVTVDGVLLDGTVRMIAPGETTVKYFFDKLLDGKTLSDYEIREVELTDPVVDADNKVVSYSDISVLGENSATDIAATALDNTTSVQTYTVRYSKGKPVKTAQSLDAENVRSDKITNVRKGGIIIDLHKWNNTDSEDTALEGGTFRLECDGKTVGTYTSDKTGSVTVLYDLIADKPYVLTQTIAPRGYTGLSKPVSFTVVNNDGVYSISTLSNENDSDDDTTAADGKYWCEYKNAPENGVAARIDLYNKPFELKAVKTDKTSGKPVDGAKFSLHRAITLYGSKVKDFNALEGFAELESGSTGVKGLIPKIDSSIAPGSYYLCENEAPTDYEKFGDDIQFSISQLGKVEIIDQQSDLLTFTENDEYDEYVISVPNENNNGTADLTITKTVEGNLGSKSKEFTFTLTVDGASDTDEYTWTKNGTVQPEPLRSGGTFTMCHADTVVVTLPAGSKLTVSEDAENYTSSFRLGNEESQQTSSETFTLDEDTTLAVTNTLDGAIPTGISLGSMIPPFALLVSIGYLFIRYKRKERREQLEQ